MIGTRGSRTITGPQIRARWACATPGSRTCGCRARRAARAPRGRPPGDRRRPSTPWPASSGRRHVAGASPSSAARGPLAYDRASDDVAPRPLPRRAGAEPASTGSRAAPWPARCPHAVSGERLVLPLLALALLAGGGTNQSTGALSLSADAKERGYVRLVLTAPPGVEVSIEDTARRSQPSPPRPRRPCCAARRPGAATFATGSSRHAAPTERTATPGFAPLAAADVSAWWRRGAQRPVSRSPSRWWTAGGSAASGHGSASCHRGAASAVAQADQGGTRAGGHELQGAPPRGLAAAPGHVLGPRAPGGARDPAARREAASARHRGLR